MVTGPTGPKGPAGPGERPVPGASASAKLPKTTATQAPATVTLTSGEAVTGVIRTRKANLTERAVKTLGQAFVGTFSAVFFGAQQLNITAARSALIAAGSATLAALLSLMQNVLFGGEPS